MNYTREIVSVCENKGPMTELCEHIRDSHFTKKSTAGHCISRCRNGLDYFP